MEYLLQELLNVIAPIFLQAISAVTLLALGWLWNLIRLRTGLEIAEKHRLALHSAIMTGAQVAIAGRLAGTTARDFILAYATRSVPDALRHLSPSDHTLQHLCDAKLLQLKMTRINNHSDV